MPVDAKSQVTSSSSRSLDRQTPMPSANHSVSGRDGSKAKSPTDMYESNLVRSGHTASSEAISTSSSSHVEPPSRERNR